MYSVSDSLPLTLSVRIGLEACFAFVVYKSLASECFMLAWDLPCVCCVSVLGLRLSVSCMFGAWLRVLVLLMLLMQVVMVRPMMMG